MRRRIVLVVAAACGLGAVLVALLPYTARISFEGQMVLGGAGIAGARGIEGGCRPPLVGAWRPGPDGTWVTAESNMKGNDGYASAGSLGRWCEDSARRRLLAAAGLAAAAVGTAMFGRRRRRPAGEAAEAGLE